MRIEFVMCSATVAHGTRQGKTPTRTAPEPGGERRLLPTRPARAIPSGMAKIYLVQKPYEADVIAAKVADPEAADLKAFIGKAGALAMGDAHWFVVSNIFYASCKLMWVEPDDPAAMLKVFVVDAPEKGGWVREDHPLRGKL